MHQPPNIPSVFQQTFCFPLFLFSFTPINTNTILHINFFCTLLWINKKLFNFSLNLVFSDFQQTEWLHYTTHFICSQILKCPHKSTKCFIVSFVFCAWSKFNRLGNSTGHQLLFRGPLLQQMSTHVLTIDNWGTHNQLQGTITLVIPSNLVEFQMMFLSYHFCKVNRIYLQSYLWAFRK